jgi:hypothetical protein
LIELVGNDRNQKVEQHNIAKEKRNEEDCNGCRHDPENLRSHSSLSHGTLHLSHMLTQLLDKHCVCSKLLFRLDGVGVI